jgi:hypothetical protein
MAQDNKNTTLIVSFSEGSGLKDVRVTAATVAHDDCYIPGYLQLRDENNLTVAYIPMSRGPLIRRQDSDPTLTPRPPAPVPRPPLATQADVARLANAGSKAGRV